MSHRTVRLVASHAKQQSLATMMDSTLAEWSEAGWRLHSHSVISHIYAGASAYEVGFLIFERDDATPE